MERPPTDEPSVPEGAAVFPTIPEELGVHPVFLAMLHAFVFLEGTHEDLLHVAVAEEALQHMAGYLQRLEGTALLRVQEDLAVLVGYAKSQEWPKIQVRFLQEFLQQLGVSVPEAGS